MNDTLWILPGDSLVWLVAAAFVIALLESLALIGILIPGILLLFAVGALVGWDVSALVLTGIAAVAGAAAGDGLSFWLGRRYQHRLMGIWPLSRHPGMVERARTLFTHHGGKSIFIARFIGPLRPVVPLVAGMSRMPPVSFALFMLPACLLWVPLFLLPGAVFGESLELAAEFGGRLALLLVLLVLGVWLVMWLTRWAYEFSARRSPWWLRSLVRWSVRHPLLERVAGPLFRPGGREVISLALLGLVFTLSLATLLVALLLAPLATPAWQAERQAATVAASLRNHFADPLLVVLSLAGSFRVVVMSAAIWMLLLVTLNRLNAAWHWLAALVGGWLSAQGLDAVMGFVLRRPEDLDSLGQVPHRGFAMNTIVLGLFAVMFASDVQPRRRKWPYLVVIPVLCLVGFAHFYLGRATLTGLVAGLAVGAIWVALAGLGYRTHTRPRLRTAAPLIALGFCGLYAGIAAWQVSAEFRFTLETTRLAQPVRWMAADAWWDSEYAELPRRRSRVGRFAVQQFDAQVAGSLVDIARRLESAGWTAAPGPGEGLTALLDPGAPSAALPHLSRDFAGRPERLLMRRLVSEDRALVVRVWSSGARLEPSTRPVWLVQVRQMERYRAAGGLVNAWRDDPAGRNAAMGALRVAGWDWAWTQPEPDGVWLARLPGSVVGQPLQ